MLPEEEQEPGRQVTGDAAPLDLGAASTCVTFTNRRYQLPICV